MQLFTNSWDTQRNGKFSDEMKKKIQLAALNRFLETFP